MVCHSQSVMDSELVRSVSNTPPELAAKRQKQSAGGGTTRNLKGKKEASVAIRSSNPSNYDSRASMATSPAASSTQESSSAEAVRLKPDEFRESASSTMVTERLDVGASGTDVAASPLCSPVSAAPPARLFSSGLPTAPDDKAPGSNPCIPRFGAEEAAASARCPSGSSESDRAYIQQYLYQKLPPVSCETDIERLTRSMQALIDNCIFHPDLDSVTAKAFLQDQDEGVFLVRNSSDSKYIFALSVKTERGATSVRIQYERGFFQLDCEERMRRRLPRFHTVMELVDFHVALCREGAGDQCRWLETSGRKDMVVRLTRPLRKSPPSLLHLARLTVNQQLKDLHLPSCSTDRLPVPEKMKDYLREYPYKV